METLAIVLHWTLLAYIWTECFICFYFIHKLGRGIRFLKYGTAAIVPFIGLVIHYLKPDELLLYLWLIPDFGITQFLIPKTIDRFKGAPQRTAI